MNDDIRKIEHMWKIASNNPHHDTNWYDPAVVKFAELVRADEREAILDLVDSYAKNNTDLAAAIRARGNT